MGRATRETSFAEISTDSAMIENGRPVVFAEAPAPTKNVGHDIPRAADVLELGEQIAGIGPEL
jgi:hypothetical protein